MKAEIDVDEWWPVFELREPSQYVRSLYVVEIPSELYERYTKAFEEFRKVQDLLGPIYDKCSEEQEKQYKEVDNSRQTRLEVQEYQENEDPQICHKCEKPQRKAIYKGGNYFGCENCAQIDPSKLVFPNLLQDSMGVQGVPLSPFIPGTTASIGLHGSSPD